MPLDPASVLGLRGDVAEAGDARLLAIAPDGAEHEIAAWRHDTPGHDRPLDLEIARSPSRGRAGVRIEDVVWTFDLRTGDVVRRVPCPHAPTRGWDTPILTWTPDELAGCHRPTSGEPLDTTVAPGVRIHIDGPLEHEPEATSHGGGGSMYFTGDPEPAVRHAAIARAQEETSRRISAERRTRVVVTVDEHVTVVQDVTGTLERGLLQVQWPPLVGPRGVLVRRSLVRGQPAEPDSFGTGSFDAEVQHPWFVGRDGVLRTLPFAFGNHPLTTLPDGRFLLGSYAAMWWDGPNEGMSVVDEDGRRETVTQEGEHVTPMGVVRAIDPRLVPAEDPSGYHSDDAWTFTSATVGDGTLTLALGRGYHGHDPAEPWMVVAMALDGITCGPPRQIAGDTPPPGAVTRVVL